MSASVLLNVNDIHAGYGAANVLQGVSFEVHEGDVLALMGRNGMGKTTTLNTICKMIAMRSGRIEFAGQNIAKIPSYKVAQMGLGLVPEGRRCFGPLTVYENLVAAARITSWSSNWTLETVYALFPRLQERMDQRAATLSGGEQQMLSIGRALMTNPKLLVLDEATEGLAPVVRQEIRAAIRTLKETGISIIIVDKSVAELSSIATKIVILEKGQSVWHGAPDQLNSEIRDRYLGV